MPFTRVPTEAEAFARGPDGVEDELAEVALAARLTAAETALTAVENSVGGLRDGSEDFTKLSVVPVDAGAEGIEVIYTTPATGWTNQLSRPIWVNVTAVAEDSTNATQVSQGIYSQVNFGDVDTAALGTVHGYSVAAIITNSGHASNEYAAHFGYVRNDELTATPGRNWFTDWGCYSAVGIQQSLHTGINLVFTNFYNGSPSSAESDGLAIIAKPGIGPGMTSTTPHWDADSYPADNAIRVLGTSGDRVTPNERAGFKQAIKIGGSGSGWTVTQSWFEKGIELRDFQNFGIHIHTRHSSAATDAPALAVDAGAGPVVIGSTAVASTGIMLNVRAPGTKDPAVEISAEAAASSISEQFRNAEGRFKLFVAGGVDAFITGTAAGDSGVRLGTAAKGFLIGGSAGPVIELTQDTKLGFYGAVPVAKQTGVAVTAAAIHAALVSLGLIAA